MLSETTYFKKHKAGIKKVDDKFNIRVLVAPLDWGLGHSTRCIPLIRYLISKGCQVTIAADGASLQLLQQEFPSLPFVHLPGYHIHYAKDKRSFALKILLQLPKILKAIRAEKLWLARYITHNPTEIVLSDNRYGLYSEKITSVILTHQLQIKAPFVWVESIMLRLHYFFLQKFDQCFVPDAAGKLNVAGVLSHPARLPALPVKYIGPLSRLSPVAGIGIVYKLLIVLSGPEPARSQLENKLYASLKNFTGKVLFVRGLPQSKEVLPVLNQVTIVNFLPSSQLELAFAQSEFIVSRSGYTTVMDILSLGKKSILIPTPGQTEQEYLGRHLHAQEWAMCVSGLHFSLEETFEAAQKFNYRFLSFNTNSYQPALDELLFSIVKS